MNRVFLIVKIYYVLCVCVTSNYPTTISKKKSTHNIGKRGKGKKKKKRALMKLLMIGAVLKAKIELLLKIVTTHLQIKFFVVAFLGLIINLARFWIDLKRGQQPQKVCI